MRMSLFDTSRVPNVPAVTPSPSTQTAGATASRAVITAKVMDNPFPPTPPANP